MGNWKFILIIISGLLLSLSALRRSNNLKKYATEQSEYELIQDKYQKAKAASKMTLSNNAWQRFIKINGESVYAIYSFDSNLNGTRFLHFKGKNQSECVITQDFVLKKFLGSNNRYDDNYRLVLTAKGSIQSVNCTDDIITTVNKSPIPILTLSFMPMNEKIQLLDFQSIELDKTPSLAETNKEESTPKEKETSELVRKYLQVSEELNAKFSLQYPGSGPISFEVQPESNVLYVTTKFSSNIPIASVKFDREGFYLKPYYWYSDKDRVQGKFSTVRFINEAGDLRTGTLRLVEMYREYAFESVSE